MYIFVICTYLFRQFVTQYTYSVDRYLSRSVVAARVSSFPFENAEFYLKIDAGAK